MTNAEQIYLQYHDKVRAYVRGKIQDPHDVEDLVSAVFMKIVQKLDSYDPAKASVSTWVYTITRKHSYRPLPHQAHDGKETAFWHHQARNTFQ